LTVVERALDAPADGSNLDAHHDRVAIADAHAVEFSKTAAPHRKGFLLEETDPTLPPEGAYGPTSEYSAPQGIMTGP
jgi:hypothetical protein